MGRAAHDHHVPYLKGERGSLVLRHIADFPGHFRRFHAEDIPSVQADVASPAVQDIADAFQQRGFTRAVGTQEAEDITVSHVEGDSGENVVGVRRRYS